MHRPCLRNMMLQHDYNSLLPLHFMALHKYLSYFVHFAVLVLDERDPGDVVG